MILVIDNYDSFTYNLVQMISSCGCEMRVFRNDKIALDEMERLSPAGLIVSPGPCTPAEAGISVESVRRFSGRIPVLGVCLGHQAIAAAFGGRVVRAGRIMHGKISMITHSSTPLYKGIRNPFPAGRYHSLAVESGSLPKDLVVDATSEDGEIMGMHHATHNTMGVQFHPESVLTPFGKLILENYIAMVNGGK